MRKFRYGDPSKQNVFRKYGSYIYLFLAWNFLAYTAWKVIDTKKGNADEEWKKKSGTEKYLTLAGFRSPGSNIKEIKIHGLTVQRDTEKEEDT